MKGLLVTLLLTLAGTVSAQTCSAQAYGDRSGDFAPAASGRRNFVAGSDSSRTRMQPLKDSRFSDSRSTDRYADNRYADNRFDASADRQRQAASARSGQSFANASTGSRVSATSNQSNSAYQDDARYNSGYDSGSNFRTARYPEFGPAVPPGFYDTSASTSNDSRASNQRTSNQRASDRFASSSRTSSGVDSQNFDPNVKPMTLRLSPELVDELKRVGYLYSSIDSQKRGNISEVVLFSDRNKLNDPNSLSSTVTQNNMQFFDRKAIIDVDDYALRLIDSGRLSLKDLVDRPIEGVAIRYVPESGRKIAASDMSFYSGRESAGSGVDSRTPVSGANRGDAYVTVEDRRSTDREASSDSWLLPGDQRDNRNSRDMIRATDYADYSPGGSSDRYLSDSRNTRETGASSGSRDRYPGDRTSSSDDYREDYLRRTQEDSYEAELARKRREQQLRDDYLDRLARSNDAARSDRERDYVRDAVNRNREVSDVTIINRGADYDRLAGESRDSGGRSTGFDETLASEKLELRERMLRAQRREEELANKDRQLDYELDRIEQRKQSLEEWARQQQERFSRYRPETDRLLERYPSRREYDQAMDRRPPSGRLASNDAAWLPNGGLVGYDRDLRSTPFPSTLAGDQETERYRNLLEKDTNSTALFAKMLKDREAELEKKLLLADSLTRMNGLGKQLDDKIAKIKNDDEGSVDSDRIRLASQRGNVGSYVDDGRVRNTLGGNLAAGGARLASRNSLSGGTVSDSFLDNGQSGTVRSLDINSGRRNGYQNYDSENRAPADSRLLRTLYLLLVASLGGNFYLGLIARSFYTRYEELADELRETFSSTSSV